MGREESKKEKKKWWGGHTPNHTSNILGGEALRLIMASSIQKNKVHVLNISLLKNCIRLSIVLEGTFCVTCQICISEVVRDLFLFLWANVMVQLVSVWSKIFHSSNKSTMLEQLPRSNPWPVATPEPRLAIGKEGANSPRPEPWQQVPLYQQKGDSAGAYYKRNPWLHFQAIAGGRVL